MLTYNRAIETTFTKAQLAKYFKFDRINFGLNVTRSIRTLRKLQRIFTTPQMSFPMLICSD
jgi:hypothetical protein